MRTILALVFLLGTALGAAGQACTGTQSTPPQIVVGPPPPHLGAGPVRVSSGVMAGMMVSKRSPVYPALAKTKGIEGTVQLHAIIGKDGTIADVTVISGPPELTEAAVSAVKDWRYRPYVLNGVPTEVQTTIMVNFHLNHSAPVPAPPVAPIPD